MVVIGDALIFDPPIAHQVDDRPWLILDDLTQRVGHYRGRGRIAASRALALVRPGVEARPETLVRLALVGAGLPEPEVNVEILRARRHQDRPRRPGVPEVPGDRRV